MDYQSYEDYMQSVLGYRVNPDSLYTGNTYNQIEDYYYDMPAMTYQHTEELNNLYPEIYKIIYPMVCKACNNNGYNTRITKEWLENTTEEIYKNVEPDERISQEVKTQLKNGDVRNPNAKDFEVKSEKRQINFILRDLIKILLLRELGRPNRPPMRPPMPPPPPQRPPYNRPPFRPIY